ncbi:hypothetical protein P7C73_g3042, partial [Tremellales sp. Uapishka_1]
MSSFKMDEITTSGYNGSRVDNEEYNDSKHYSDNKDGLDDVDVKAGGDVNVTAVLNDREKDNDRHDLQVDQDELARLEARMAAMPLERCVGVVNQLVAMHKHDQNFPAGVLQRLFEFQRTPEVLSSPNKYPELVHEIKMECLLATENSPYLEVRANVDATDDPTLPVFTVRVWIIGCVFSAAGSFIDTLFGYRNPAVYVGTNVGQLLAYPVGKLLAKILPDVRFRLFGREHSLNPGPFNKKEHMLITIMANVSFTAPYTNYIVPAQALPVFFNQAWAYNRGYQFLSTIGTNFVGYGLAGLTRRFLVYPSVAVWPATLNTIGLIKAFHSGVNEPVRGPFNRVYTASREKVFMFAFFAMFFYFFFPGYIFQALSVFSWMTWISPNNATLDTVTGFYSGMGLNPWPTFDWNNLTVWLSPLTIPTFAIINQFFGILVGAIMCLGFYYGNAWNTGYIPINSNSAFDNTGVPYNVSRILNADNLFDDAAYQEYSQPWMAAGFLASYFWYFAMYSATLTYVAIFHRYDAVVGAKSMWKSIKRTFARESAVQEEDDLSEDVHFRLMKQNYKEVHEWVYAVVLIIAMVIGMVGVGIYPTNTSPVVLIFGIIFSLLTILPCGIIQAVTGIPIPLNVLAEFIGGSLVEGNANGLMYFKTYGYISTYNALAFSNDLKLAHYLKIPPRLTFTAQMVATMIYCVVSAAVFNFAMGFPNVCTETASFRFTCPNQRTFFTAAIFWGTISPKRLFGSGGRYNLLLLGFPLGILLVVAYYFARRRYPYSEMLRQVHPVMFAAGPANWGSPYNMSFYIGNVYVVLFSFQFIRKRYLEFWAKYNYIIAAAFPAGIAFSALVIFFALEIPKGGLSIDWWGNSITAAGCEGLGGCPDLVVPVDPGYFGGAPGSFAK